MAKSNLRVVLVSLGVLAVVALIAGFSSRTALPSSGASLPQNGSKNPASAAAASPKRRDPKDLQDFEARFPTTDYDAPEPTNQEEKIKRKNKNKHYDGQNLVMSNPTNSGSGVASRSAVFDALPALPVTQSDVILTGDVLNSEAHLSNDKTGIYSEFTIQIDTVLKGSIPTLSQGNLISVSRVGGKVRYRSGRTQTYEIAGQRMPALGKKYLFFLGAVDDSFEIITGYEIDATVQPLDFSRQFQAWTGTDSAEFLNKVRQALAN